METLDFKSQHLTKNVILSLTEMTANLNKKIHEKEKNLCRKCTAHSRTTLKGATKKIAMVMFI